MAACARAVTSGNGRKSGGLSSHKAALAGEDGASVVYRDFYERWCRPCYCELRTSLPGSSASDRPLVCALAADMDCACASSRLWLWRSRCRRATGLALCTQRCQPRSSHCARRRTRARLLSPATNLARATSTTGLPHCPRCAAAPSAPPIARHALGTCDAKGPSEPFPGPHGGLCRGPSARRTRWRSSAAASRPLRPDKKGVNADKELWNHIAGRTALLKSFWLPPLGVVSLLGCCTCCDSALCVGCFASSRGGCCHCWRSCITSLLKLVRFARAMRLAPKHDVCSPAVFAFGSPSLIKERANSVIICAQFGSLHKEHCVWRAA